MNLQQAKQALFEGKRVRHKYFGEREYLEGNIKIDGYVSITNEGGYAISEQDFSNIYSKDNFDEGWEIVPTEFEAGMAWQKERSYSEKEVNELLWKAHLKFSGDDMTGVSAKAWIETQLKR